jgi:predicted DNA-binding protein (UPF0251 family)
MLADGTYLCDRGSFKQYHPEVYSPDGLRVSRAMKELCLDEREVLFVHYAIRGIDATDKAKDMMLSRSTYYRRLKAGNHNLSLVIE